MGIECCKTDAFELAPIPTFVTPINESCLHMYLGGRGEREGEGERERGKESSFPFSAYYVCVP